MKKDTIEKKGNGMLYITIAGECHPVRWWSSERVPHEVLRSRCRVWLKSGRQRPVRDLVEKGILGPYGPKREIRGPEVIGRGNEIQRLVSPRMWV